MPSFALPQTKDSDKSDKGLAKIVEGASSHRHAETSPLKVKDTHLMNNKLPPAEILCGDWTGGELVSGIHGPPFSGGEASEGGGDGVSNHSYVTLLNMYRWWHRVSRNWSNFQKFHCVSILPEKAASNSWRHQRFRQTWTLLAQGGSWLGLPYQGPQLEGSLGSFSMPLTFSVFSGCLNTSEKLARRAANYGAIAGVFVNSTLLDTRGRKSPTPFKRIVIVVEATMQAITASGTVALNLQLVHQDVVLDHSLL